ncbi:4-hydroxy-tetrahydrodipicolinate reductase [Clostridium sp. SYSU_GA19001]|uniref:4-hydroxy-tetrahydrodipicolinate reductase n=1 Tax=Clostridium caldaquaticum TaxID=2940653 RepID=UPI00207720D7|nr:4-hydroxy-tetrahydrodipicolinate reductase [Clostridium caldaquaticum]MCM8711625.1 4-hydroxy-tetrahydrodipicolinate reductase [Clostridium caldaquaticum]
MIKVLLNGCSGKMGTMVTAVSKNFSNLKIVAGVDKFKTKLDYPIYENISECSENIDVVLDFSRPDSLDNLLNYCKEKNIPLVLCTTGFTAEQLQKIDEYSNIIPIFHSANMSLGVNVVNSILKKISALLYTNFDIEIIEKHHNQKVDSPSGTAILLANTIKDSISDKTQFVYGREGIGKREHKDIGIHAVRGGSIVGEHEVIFAGQGEIIEIKHTALSREVFAVGALKACEFMHGKNNGLYNMDDLIENPVS